MDKIPTEITGPVACHKGRGCLRYIHLVEPGRLLRPRCLKKWSLDICDSSMFFTFTWMVDVYRFFFRDMTGNIDLQLGFATRTDAWKKFQKIFSQMVVEKW